MALTYTINTAGTVAIPADNLDYQSIMHWLSENVGELISQSPFASWYGNGWEARIEHYVRPYEGNKPHKRLVVKFRNEQDAVLYSLRWL